MKVKVPEILFYENAAILKKKLDQFYFCYVSNIRFERAYHKSGTHTWDPGPIGVTRDLYVGPGTWDPPPGTLSETFTPLYQLYVIRKITWRGTISI